MSAELEFGPWNPARVGETAVSGTYTYDDIQFSHFRSIFGVGHARGRFAGALANIATQGSIDVTGFRVEGVDHAVALSTTFDAMLKLGATWGVKGLDAQLAEINKSLLVTVANPKATDAERIERNVPVYRARETAGAERGDLHAELTEALLSGPGVVVFEGAFDAGVLDRASAVFHSLIEAQQQLGTSTGDHRFVLTM